jgi:hypothetical protein
MCVIQEAELYITDDNTACPVKLKTISPGFIPPQARHTKFMPKSSETNLTGARLRETKSAVLQWSRTVFRYNWGISWQNLQASEKAPNNDN